MNLRKFHLLILGAGICWLVSMIFLLIHDHRELVQSSSFRLLICTVLDANLNRLPDNSGQLNLNLWYRNSFGQLTETITLVASNWTRLNILLNTTYKPGSIIGCGAIYSIEKNLSNPNLTYLEGNIYLDVPDDIVFLALGISFFVVAAILGLVYAGLHILIWRRRRDYQELEDEAVKVGNRTTLMENFESDLKQSEILNSFPVAQNAFWKNQHLLTETEIRELKRKQVDAVMGINVRHFQESVYQILNRKVSR